MLNLIEASPKVNEVIACQRYCFRDLTKWPKLNRIWWGFWFCWSIDGHNFVYSQAQFVFFERLIFTLNLNEEKLLAECTRLGQTHAQYAQYGLKPHFLDIFQHQFLGFHLKNPPKTFSLSGLLEKMHAENESEKREVVSWQSFKWLFNIKLQVDAFQVLTSFILDVLNHAYSMKMSELRLAGGDKSGGGSAII